MEFVTLQEDFQKAVNIASRFISSHPQLPVLSNLLLAAQNGKLQISATNLETGIHVWVGADVKTAGQTTVVARTIQEVLGTVKQNRIEVLETDGICRLSTGDSSIDLPTTPPNDFPAIPDELPKVHFNLPVDLFQTIAIQVAFAAAGEETKPEYTGILFLPHEDVLDIVATDGIRLSQKRVTIKTPLKESLLIPARFITELPRIFSSLEKNSQIGVAVDQNKNQVLFGTDKLILVGRIIEGTFPDFSRIIPTSWKTRVTLDKEELEKAVGLASVFAEDYKVEFTIAKTKVALTSKHPQFGSQESTIPAKTEGEEMVIAFNCRFIKDVLGALKGDEVCIELTSPLAPGVFKDPKDEQFLHLIMPIRTSQS